MNEQKQLKRRYLTITEVQNEYLPLSKKKIRQLIQQSLPVKRIGNRILIDRIQLEEYLTNTAEACFKDE